MIYLNLFSVLRSKHIVMIMILLVMAVTVTVKGIGIYSSGMQPYDARAMPISTASSADQNKKVKRVVETELITLRPTGFEPAEITRPAGEFILMVENNSGKPISLRFARETGERLHEARVTREEPDWNELVDLRPGRYLLTEADHPKWKCRLTINAR